jgi:hypothetical protein
MKRIPPITITPTIKVQIAFFSFMESPSNSLSTTKFPKNHITSSYHKNLSKTAKAIFWPPKSFRGYTTFKGCQVERLAFQGWAKALERFSPWLLISSVKRA